MTLEERIQGLRLRALYRAVELGNASQVCRELGISRSLFYRWKKRFDQYGPEGLHPRRRGCRRGRPSIPPEVLLKAQILIALYSVRSERLFCERLQYDFLFRWFLDLPGVGTAFDATTFTRNGERLLEADLLGEFFREVIEEAHRSRLLSDEHFTVDGTLIEACASMKSFRPRSGDDLPTSGGSNADVDFRGQKRSNATHGSTTDPEAKLFRKGDGKPSQLCYVGHVLMENCNGLCTDALVSQADGRAEPEAALAMVRRSIDASRRRVTLGADKGYDIGEFQVALAEEGVLSHVAQKERVTPVLDRRTTGRSEYKLSQRKRKRVEEIFGWAKTVARMGKTRFRGVGFIQGDESLVGPIAGSFMPPAANLSVRVAPALQGTAEYTLTAYDRAARVIALRSVVVTEDTGDPATISFGYFTLELDVLSGGARYFSVTNRFIRSSFSEITSIPFGVSSLTYSTPRQTH